MVPTGYSFNLDGTAIYLTMASLFIASALGDPLSIGEQVSLLLFMMIASKGAAGVTGAGMATLAGGLSSHRPELLDGVGLIVGIDRFMSEARALTNFAGNSIATVLIAHWTGGLDRPQLDRVLAGSDPFDEMTMVDDGDDFDHVPPGAAAAHAGVVPEPARDRPGLSPRCTPDRRSARPGRGPAVSSGACRGRPALTPSSGSGTRALRRTVRALSGHCLASDRALRHVSGECLQVPGRHRGRVPSECPVAVVGVP